MLATRTKKVAVYGRRGQRVVAVSSGLDLSAEKASAVRDSDEEQKEDIWTQPRAHSKKAEDVPKESARGSAATTITTYFPRQNNATKKSSPPRAQAPAKKRNKGTPVRQPFGMFPPNIPNSPALPPKIARRRTSAVRKYGRSTLTKSFVPFVDVEITVMDDNGRTLSKERRGSSTHNPIVFSDSDGAGGSTTTKRHLPVRSKGKNARSRIVDDSDDSDDDDDYVPQVSDSRNSRRGTGMVHARKTKCKQKPIRITEDSESSPAIRHPRRRATTYKRIITSDSSTSPTSESENEPTCTSRNVAQRKKDRQTGERSAQDGFDTLARPEFSSVAVVLPRLSETLRNDKSPFRRRPNHSSVRLSQTAGKASVNLPSHQSSATFGNSPPFRRQRVLTPYAARFGSSSEVSDGNGVEDSLLDVSIDEELAEALRNADLDLETNLHNLPPSPRPLKASALKTSTEAVSSKLRLDGMGPTCLSMTQTLRTTSDDYLGPLLRECEQEGPIDFDAFIETFPFDALHTSTETKLRFVKIAEASYSEVFGIGDVVLKIIPLLPERRKQPRIENGIDQPFMSEPRDVLKELLVTRLMGDICQGFIKLLGARIVRGKYPPLLLKLWDTYNNRKGSEGVRPDKFSGNQLYATIILPNEGSDLETTTFGSSTSKHGWRQACSLFWQVARSLARAEDLVQFEHRDLHWGQVLVKFSEPEARIRRRTINKISIDENSSMDDPAHGVQATIIDLGLCRINPVVAHLDDRMCWTPFDEDIFCGEGDYQYDVYRMMKCHNRDCWTDFNPLTNIMWLHYLADKLLHNMGLRAPIRPRQTQGPNANVNPNSLGERRAYECLVQLEEILARSVQSLATAVGAKQRPSNRRKQAVSVTQPDVSLGGATDLVWFGMSLGWVK